MLAGHLQQVMAALPLLPQRGALTRPAPGQQQRPGRILAEARGEEGRPMQLCGDKLADLLRVEQQVLDVRRPVGLGEAERKAVVRIDHLDFEIEPLLHSRPRGHRPGRMDASPERRQHRQPPIAELIPEALDHDGAVGRHRSSGLNLVREVIEQVAGRPIIEARALLQSSDGGVGLHRGQLAHRRAHGASDLYRPAQRVAVPERDPPRLAGRGRHHHLGRRDVGDPPGGGPKHKGFTRPHLVDHLFVQLADALAVVEQVDGEQATVRDGPATHDRQALGAGAATDCSFEAVPDDARAQLGEFIGRITAAQHVECRLQGARPQIAEGIGAMDQLRKGRDRPLLHGGHRHDLLGENIERIAGDPGRFDLAAQHSVDDDRSLEQIAPVLGEDGALRRLADRVAGAADPLNPAGDAGGRLHLDDQVDGAHVDAELQAGGGDQPGETAGLERILY